MALTERAPLVSVNPYDIDYHSGSIGLPVPSTEAKLVDDDDNEVPPVNRVSFVSATAGDAGLLAAS